MLRTEYLPFGKPDFGKDEISAVTRVMQSGWVGMGAETICFEEELATYTGAAHVATVNSCTSALFLSLLTENIGPEDEVIVPSLTWCSSANAILYAGAKVVFCDIHPVTLNATTETILVKVTTKTRAVIIVHYGGLAINVKELRKHLPNHIAIIEDAAHAIGATYEDGTMVGSSGNLTCFSFYANKNLATAEGGAIALNDSVRNDRLKSLRLHALQGDAWKRYTHAQTIFKSAELTELGYKLNYTDLQASIGRVQLKRQAEFNKTRLQIAEFYHTQLSQIHDGISCQSSITSPGHARHLFVMILPENKTICRDDLLIGMRERNIGASIHYAPLHMMSLYRNSTQNLPVTEDISTRILTLPISASMTMEDARDVIHALDHITNERVL